MRDSYAFYVDKLEGEYREAFRGVEAYVIGLSADDDTMEEKMNALLDLFFNAQEDGKPVQKLVGKNIENFCDIYFSDLNWKNRTLEFFDRVKTLAWWLLILGILEIISVLGTVSPGDVDFSTALGEDDLLSFITIFLSTYIISRLAAGGIRRLLFRTKKLSYRAMWWIQLLSGLLIGALILIVAFHFNYEVRIPVWTELIASAIYLILYYLFNRKRVAQRKSEKISFSSLIDEQYPETMMDTFHSENKWRKRFHRPELTMEDYVKRIEKNHRMNQKYGFFLYYIFPAVLTLLITMGMFCFQLFESPNDAICYLVLLLVIEYALFIPLGQMGKNNDRRVEKWLNDYYQNSVEEDKYTK